MIRLRNKARDGLTSVVSSEIPPKLTQPSLIRAKRRFLAKENKAGFTLIEVLLAVAIIGIVLGPIYLLQSAVFERVIRAAGSVDRMLVAYDFFVDVKHGDEDIVKKNIADPQMDLVYEKKEPSKGSVLAKEFNHISIEKLSWHWKYQDTSYSDVLVDIAFMPPESADASADASSVASADAQGAMADRQKAMAGQGQEAEKKSPSSVAQKAMTDSQKTGDQKKSEDKNEEKRSAEVKKS